MSVKHEIHFVFIFSLYFVIRTLWKEVPRENKNIFGQLKSVTYLLYFDQ